MTMLERFGLRFSDYKQEAAFRSRYCLINIRIVQVYMIFGALLVYAFSVWDRIIDPVNWEAAHAIRGIILVPTIVFGAAALWSDGILRAYEYFALILGTVVSFALCHIYVTLENGFDYGVTGTILLIMFMFSVIQVRVLYLVAFSVFCWSMFVYMEIKLGSAKNGMLFVNNVCLATSISLGLFSAIVRELDAKKSSVLSSELKKSRDWIDELLQSILPKDIVSRIQSGEGLIAEFYDDVTIVFADLVGFTEFSRRISPHQLINFLNLEPVPRRLRQVSRWRVDG